MPDEDELYRLETIDWYNKNSRDDAPIALIGYFYYKRARDIENELVRRYSQFYHSIRKNQRLERDLYPRNLYGKGWTRSVGSDNHLLYGDSTDEGMKCVQVPLPVECMRQVERCILLEESLRIHSLEPREGDA